MNSSKSAIIHNITIMKTNATKSEGFLGFRPLNKPLLSSMVAEILKIQFMQDLLAFEKLKLKNLGNRSIIVPHKDWEIGTFVSGKESKRRKRRKEEWKEIHFMKK